MESKATFIVRWKPVNGGTVSSYLTDSLEDAIETFRINARLGFAATIECQ